MSVDERSVYAGGRRRLRRRVLRRTGLGLGAAAAAAAVAFAVAGPGLGGEALPAGPSPSSSATSSQRVSAEVLDGRYAVEVIPNAAADQPNVVYYRKQTETGAMIRLAGSDASPQVVSLGSGSGAEGVMLGTAPADARQFVTITKDGTSGGVEQDTKPLPGTDYQAIALRFEHPAETEKYVDTIWTNGVDEVRSANGTVLPTVPIAGGDRFFVASEARVMGVFMAEGVGASTKPLSGTATTTMGYGQRPDNGSWTWTSATLLPEGARDVSFTWANAQTTTKVTVKSLGTAEVAYAEATAPGAGSGPVVGTVLWTDKAGTRHTDAVE